MELRHLRYFVAVCEMHSFSRAAETLHVTQPTLSHQIRQLEDEVGTPLLHRLGRRTEPTPAGAIFLSHSREVLRQMSAAVEAIGELEGLLRGALNVAVFHSFATSNLPHVFAEFASLFPGVRLVVRQVSREKMERELLDGSLDLAIGYSQPNDPRIRTQELFVESLVLVIGAMHPWKSLHAVEMRRLTELPLVLLTPEFGARNFLDRYFAEHGLQPRIVLEMDAIDPILSIVGGTALASVLPTGAVGRDDKVSSIGLVDPVPQRSAALCWRALGNRSRAACTLAEMIIAACISTLIAPPR